MGKRFAVSYPTRLQFYPINANDTEEAHIRPILKKLSFRTGALVLSMGIFLVGAEIFLRFACPQETLYPRSGFSPEYCSIPFANVVMVHAKPGRWCYRYTTNRYHHRGPAVTPAQASATRNVVVLGDSYSFGIGVNDGEEFPSILQQQLGATFGVVNLSAGGWGLTQEIRRFYDLGASYHPQEVIVQFCLNDLTDDLSCRVTRLEEGQFRFQDCDLGMYRIKELLSRSVLQKSQLYNLVRDSVYSLAESSQIASASASAGAHASGEVLSNEESLYFQLLEAFARDLKTRESRLVILAVNRQLHACPALERKILDLQREDLLEYYDAADWLAGEKGYESPEGHLWGQKAHRIIGERLAGVILGEGSPK